MPVFEYKAQSAADGRIVSSTIEAPNAPAGISTLRDRGLVVTTIKETRARKKTSGAQKTGRRKRVSLDDLVVFSRQLATIVNAGLPLIEGLNILGDQMENLTFRQMVKQIEKDVEGGSTLSDALSKHPKVFSVLYVNLVRAGEASGMLDDILVQLSTYLEKTAALKRKVKSATIYPIIVICVAVIIVALLMIKVIPVFERIFAGFGAELPKPTQVVIAISHFAQAYWFYILIALIVFGFVFKRYLSTPGGRMKFDSLLLRLPVLGVLFRKVAVARFTRTFSTLLRSGVNILVSLDIVARTSGNMVVEKAIDRTRTSIKEGENIAGPLIESEVFPPMVTRMIDVGERTGALDEMLGKIADFYEEQVDTAVSGLTSMLEPIMIVFLGVIVGGVVIAMFMPLFKLTTIIEG